MGICTLPLHLEPGAQGAAGVPYMYAGAPPPAMAGAVDPALNGAGPQTALGPGLGQGGLPVGATGSRSEFSPLGAGLGGMGPGGDGASGAGGRAVPSAGAGAGAPQAVTVTDEYLAPPASSFAGPAPGDAPGLPAHTEVAADAGAAGGGPSGALAVAPPSAEGTGPGMGGPTGGTLRAALASPRVSGGADGAAGGGSKLAQRLNNLTARGEGLLHSLAQGLGGGGGTPERSAGSGARLGQARPCAAGPHPLRDVHHMVTSEP